MYDATLSKRIGRVLTSDEVSFEIEQSLLHQIVLHDVGATDS